MENKEDRKAILKKKLVELKEEMNLIKDEIRMLKDQEYKYLVILDIPLKNRFESYAESNRMHKSQVAREALEQYLTKKGF